MRKVGYCPEHEGTYEDLNALEFTRADRAARLFAQRRRERAKKMLASST